jgi:hypothetical protein
VLKDEQPDRPLLRAGEIRLVMTQIHLIKGTLCCTNCLHRPLVVLDTKQQTRLLRYDTQPSFSWPDHETEATCSAGL